MKVSMTINGQHVTHEVEGRFLLSDLLRDVALLTGTHRGCDTAQCGACTVHVDGQAVKSCNMLALQADGCEVVTIEGLASDDGTLHPMQEAFRECHGLQCGFCTPGMVMAAIDLVRKQTALDDTTIRAGLDGNICRCTGYENIIRAVSMAAQKMSV